MHSRSRQILEKSTAALLAGIEIYNKPNFEYREETFSILVVNAWELLLKARILQLSGNRHSSIIEYEKRPRADGSLSEKLYRKKNRSGNHVSVGLFKAYDLLTNEYRDRIPSVVRTNVEALCQVRDNAVHFLNRDPNIQKKVHELGTASIKNYLYLMRQWFGSNLDAYQLYLLPIGFIGACTTAEGVVLNAEERNWINYITGLENDVDDNIENETNLTLDIDIKFRRSGDAEQEVRITNNPDALEVQLSEEDMRDRYPWDYQILSSRLDRRFINFRQNQQYHTIRQRLEENPQLCRVRYLDPGNPRSSIKRFYSPNILREFDGFYTRRT